MWPHDSALGSMQAVVTIANSMPAEHAVPLINTAVMCFHGQGEDT